MTEPKFTKGPWPAQYTGDCKRIVIGKGLVEGPNGYEIAEVYSDDCPHEVAEANAHLIAAAPEMYAALIECRMEFWSVWHSHMSEEQFLSDPTIQVIDAALKKARGLSDIPRRA